MIYFRACKKNNISLRKLPIGKTFPLLNDQFTTLWIIKLSARHSFLSPVFSNMKNTSSHICHHTKHKPAIGYSTQHASIHKRVGFPVETISKPPCELQNESKIDTGDFYSPKTLFIFLATSAGPCAQTH